MMPENQYNPDYASPPGETVQELLDSLGMSQAELAERTGRPKKTINEIVNGKSAITPETAIQFERVLGVPAHFWNNREKLYREALAQSSERDALQGQLDWLKEFPLAQMIKWKWVPKAGDQIDQMRALLSYFGVGSPEQWTDFWEARVLAFRKSAAFEPNAHALSAWVRRGELLARSTPCNSFDPALFKEHLQKIRALTTEPPDVFEPRLRDCCAAAGVVVLFVPELEGTRASGVTQWLGSDKAIIQLSLRYKTDDHLWFTFFHEAGHILLHGKKEIFIEDHRSSKNDRELEANRFSAETLIPSSSFRNLKQYKFLTKARVRAFAAEIGISPGIVVGRLQHEGLLPRTHCNDLKRRFVFKESVQK